jgi:hypothetical protein
MVSRIPHEPRSRIRQTFYTKGEVADEINFNFFKPHLAEPNDAANILERNPSNFEMIEVKPRPINPNNRGKTPGAYTRRKNMLDSYNPPISLSELKIAHSRNYSE